MAMDVTTDCVRGIIYVIIQIALFLYYWQATEPRDEESSPGLASPEASDQIRTRRFTCTPQF
jgi:hypothetical protein